MDLGVLVRASEYQKNYEKKVFEAASYLRNRIFERTYGISQIPCFGIVLGSGLGGLANEIKKAKVIDYKDIPNFPTPTVSGHAGKLILGELEGVSVIGLQGRKHFYEVADDPFTGMLQVVFPVHVLASLDVPNYFATNAAGGLNEQYAIGDIMAIKSHINLLPNPLLGRAHDFRRVDNNMSVNIFQPMNAAYDANLRAMLLRSCPADQHIHEGTYMAVTGPSYETEAESKAFRDGFGADAIGMSTTPEIIIARNHGMKCVAMSCITNKIAPDGTNATSHEEVKRILDSPEINARLSSTVRNFFISYKNCMELAP